MIISKDFLSAIAVVLTFVAFIPYIYYIFLGIGKPHVFTWLIWGMTTLSVFFAQIKSGGGVGAWPIGVSGVVMLFIACLAYCKSRDTAIYKIDWIGLGVCFSSLLVWYLTSNPLGAVVILTVVDLLGFMPNLRKECNFADSESLLYFIFMAARNCLVVIALEKISLTTALFPLMTGAACIVSVVLLLLRGKYQYQ